MNDSLRQTGRTTRMLEEAVRLAHDGKSVYIIAATLDDISRTEKLLGGERTAHRLGIRIGCIAWIEGQLGGLDLKTMEPKQRVGLRPNSVFLFDHFALELYLSNALETLHKYDLNP